VQIGDPITGKQVIDALLQASERGLFRAIQTAAPAACPQRSARWASRPVSPSNWRMCR